jgi:hypothetical protein
MTRSCRRIPIDRILMRVVVSASGTQLRDLQPPKIKQHKSTRHREQSSLLHSSKHHSCERLGSSWSICSAVLSRLAASPHRPKRPAERRHDRTRLKPVGQLCNLVLFQQLQNVLRISSPSQTQVTGGRLRGNKSYGTMIDEVASTLTTQEIMKQKCARSSLRGAHHDRPQVLHQTFQGTAGVNSVWSLADGVAVFLEAWYIFQRRAVVQLRSIPS